MQSMDEIYQKYAKRVYKYLLSLIHNQDVAEELTQETFYQAIQNIDRFDGSLRLSASSRKWSGLLCRPPRSSAPE